MKFTAVAFDLDGTLYHDFSLFVRLVPFLFKHQRLLRAMGRARDVLREESSYEGDFYATQARLMGEYLDDSAEIVMEKTDRLIYRGWEPYFKAIRLFPHVVETLENFRKAGIKIGMLSDFPPEAKLANMKIDGYFETIVCSEMAGRLKPATLPFMELAFRMKAEPRNILYVGNSVSYDVEGARKAGMKTALVCSAWRKYLLRTGKRAGADFCFSDYRQLNDYVLS
jgi:putative hydrolase of the HAD superfamily